MNKEIDKFFEVIDSYGKIIEYGKMKENNLGADGTPLKYEQFKKYYVDTKEKGHWVFKFDNNYGASVIKHYGSYGYEQDLFELAVIYWDNDKYEISYNTELTDDVIGYLTNDDVIRYLNKIKKL